MYNVYRSFPTVYEVDDLMENLALTLYLNSRLHLKFTNYGFDRKSITLCNSCT